MPPRKSRPVLFELVRREKGGQSATRTRPAQVTNGTSAPSATPPTIEPAVPRRETAVPPRLSSRAKPQTPLAGFIAQVGMARLITAGIGGVLVILLTAQIWSYLTRDSKPNSEANTQSTEQPSGNGGAAHVQPPSPSGSGRSNSRSREPSASDAEAGTQRGQLPPLVGNQTGRSQSNSPDSSDSSSKTSGERAAPPSEPRPAAANEPKPLNAKDLKPQAPTETSNEQWDASLQKGKHYVVIAHYKKNDLPQAQAAAAFLQQRGVQCLVHESKNAFMVVATQPFLINQKDATARKAQQARADEFKRRIKSLGREHSRGSGNAFDQCYERLF